MDIINDGILWEHIIQRIQAGFGLNLGCGHDIYTDGNRLYALDKNTADVIADFLEMLGYDVYTGFVDNSKEEYGNFYYIEIK